MFVSARRVLSGLPLPSLTNGLTLGLIVSLTVGLTACHVKPIAEAPPSPGRADTVSSTPTDANGSSSPQTIAPSPSLTATPPPSQTTTTPSAPAKTAADERRRSETEAMSQQGRTSLADRKMAEPAAGIGAGGRVQSAERSSGISRNMAAPSAPIASPIPMPPPPPPMMAGSPEDRERYQALIDNPVQQVAQAPVSTFSIDVDTGAYANVRRMLNAGRLPPADAVRVEEMINYFPYDYERPRGDTPFAVHTELARAPWNSKRLLMRVAIKGQDAARETLPPANLVFLVDVSGSMSPPERLPLLKSSLKLLVDALRPQDRVSLVTYASGTAVVLEATPGSDKARISNAIDALQARGSTAGASGIELAYRMARQGFIAGGINRILLATDGDFNVGVTDFRQLKNLVEERRKSGVSLSTLGFGVGNYNEQLMEQLADAGDGAYSYIDNLMEGHKVLVNEMTSTLATIARDVKIQVEFNPAAVSEYRLIGYENRLLAREDFNNDKVDAGDIGAGHTVTALYELTLAGEAGQIDPLRYGAAGARRDEVGAATAAARPVGELAFVKLRYKRANGETDSRLIEQPVRQRDLRDIASADNEFRFATAIAGFGQILRGGKYTGNWSLADARALAAGGLGNDRFGYRAEALRLMDLAGALGSRAPLAQRAE